MLMLSDGTAARLLEGEDCGDRENGCRRVEKGIVASVHWKIATGTRSSATKLVSDERSRQHAIRSIQV
jgi:hypothetical protein